MPSSVPRETDAQFLHDVEEAASFIIEKLGKCDVALVLGSGLGGFPDAAFGEDRQELRYADIPHMPGTAVVGHAGLLIAGSIGPNKVLCFSGRFHSYEGYDYGTLTMLPRLARACGCHTYLVTNAAGAVGPGMQPGSGMIIMDHMPMVRWNPLAGFSTTEYGEGEVYSTELAELAESIARRPDFVAKTRFTLEGRDRKFELFRGPYGMFSGPSYETPAEVRWALKMGVGTVGMSTIPEVAVAHQLGMAIFGMSVCTNMAAGLGDGAALNHAEVKACAEACSEGLNMLFMELIKALPKKELPPAPTADELMEGHKSQIICPQPAAAVSKLRVKAVVKALKEALDIPKDAQIGRMIWGQKCESTEKKCVCLGEIAGAENLVTSEAGRETSLSYCPDTQSICVHWPKCPVGMTGVEAEFIAAIGRKMGALHAVVIVPRNKMIPIAGDRSESTLLFTFDDTLDQTLAVYAPRPRIEPECARCSLSKAECEMKTAIQRALCDVHQCCVSFHPGPSNPSPFTLLCAEKMGAQYATTLSYAPLLGLRMMGIPFVVLAVKCGECCDAMHKVLPAMSEVAPSAPIGCITYVAEDRLPADISHPFIVGLGDPSVVDGEAHAICSRLGIECNSIHQAVFFDASWLGHNCPFELSGETIYEGAGSSSYMLWPGRKDVLLVCAHMNGWDWADHLENACLPVRVARKLGADHIIIADRNKHGEEVIIPTDHINLTGNNPLRGHNVDEWGTRFPDMGEVYTKARRAPMVHWLREHKVPVKEGVVVICAEGDHCVTRLQERLYTSPFVNAVGIAESGALLPLIAARHGGCNCTAIMVPHTIEPKVVKEAIQQMFK